MAGSISSIITIVVIILIAAIIALSMALYQLHQRLKKFMVGKDASSLEATLAWLTEKSARVDDALVAHKEALEMIDARVKHSIRGYALVRYDAYDGSGGEQSFACGLLDEHGDGHILSVITNRNHVGVYAKKILAGNAESPLTDEEQDALVKAKKSLLL